MNFRVVERGGISSDDKLTAFLEIDKWNDWFEYVTMFRLSIVDDNGAVKEIGNVKIGQFGMTPKQTQPEIKEAFTSLGDAFFSLGQDDSYYQNLNDLGEETRTSVLKCLRDVSFDQELFLRAFSEHVMQRSLLRDINPNTVRGQFTRLAQGGLRLSQFEFQYTSPKPLQSKINSISISFVVNPGSMPPSNIHVLIGRNGVGKTFLLNNMLQALVSENIEGNRRGYFSFGLETEDPFSKQPTRSASDSFSNIVSVSFSAFDNFSPDDIVLNKKKDVRYSCIGLKNDSERAAAPKTPQELATDFGESIALCRSGARAKRWKQALETLEADPIFRDANIVELADEELNDRTRKKLGREVFDGLSSGHKIILLTVSRLVEKVEEKTLVLLDEPEAHLHPPLLSAFVRALSDLLIDRNGVGIIATHSPVVLQEVPKNCVWKISKSGDVVKAERPEIETFGENVGILTREVFGLEVTHSGFHKLLRDAVIANSDFRAILESFNGDLGGEAKAIVQALIAANSTGDQV